MSGTIERLGLEGVGAAVVAPSTTRFVVWAPYFSRVSVRLLAAGGDRVVALEPGERGYHRGVVEGCPAGTLYRYVADDRQLADPASRSQPHGVLGPSEVVDPDSRRWEESGYRPLPLARQVIYECHVGSLSAAGTLDGVVSVLDHVSELGATAIELMPICELAGTRNWGYDGVFPFAVASSYGGPPALARLVEACHRRGLAVVLDVVHNHLGPVGNVLTSFGPYLTDRYKTPWGPAMNFDQPGSDEVRGFFFESVVQWFADFHIDALRLDAVHSIMDTSSLRFLSELSVLAAKLEDLLQRPCPLIAESASNDPAVVTPISEGGLGLHAQWNDDFHHALHAAITGERVGYYVDFHGVQDLARAMDAGFVYQGQRSTFRGCRHGAPSGHLAPERFVVFAQNHDHVGNRPLGRRLASLVPMHRLELVAALVLLAPGVPLIFMGEEYAEKAPFPFFVDYVDPVLLAAVREGRVKQLGGLGFAQDPLDPADQATYASSTLDRSQLGHEENRRLFDLYKALIGVRLAHPSLSQARRCDVSAWAQGKALVLLRSIEGDPSCAIFNVGPEPTTVSAPQAISGTCVERMLWRRELGTERTGIDGEGAPDLSDRLREQSGDLVAPGEAVSLKAWSFWFALAELQGLR
ncbi:MAG: malto-oligosyltrehalose trehalohydrolase [Acidimicrobiales bacterium]